MAVLLHFAAWVRSAARPCLLAPVVAKIATGRWGCRPRDGGEKQEKEGERWGWGRGGDVVDSCSTDASTESRGGNERMHARGKKERKHTVL